MKIGILFDLDGTLWNTEELTLKSFNDISQKHNAEEVTIDAVRKGMGFQKLDAINIYYPNTNEELACKMVNEMQELNSKRLKEGGAIFYPHLHDVIELLSKKYKLYIVSNTIDSEYINAFLLTSNLKNYFTDTIAAAKEKMTKAKAIEHMIKKHNIDKAFYVGDTALDKKSANEANATFIYATYGFGKIDNNYKINSLNDLPSIVENIL